MLIGIVSDTHGMLRQEVKDKEVIVITSNTVLGGMTPEEAIWSAEEIRCFV